MRSLAIIRACATAAQAVQVAPALAAAGMQLLRSQALPSCSQSWLQPESAPTAHANFATMALHPADLAIKDSQPSTSSPASTPVNAPTLASALAAWPQMLFARNLPSAPEPCEAELDEEEYEDGDFQELEEFDEAEMGEVEAGEWADDSDIEEIIADDAEDGPSGKAKAK